MWNRRVFRSPQNDQYRYHKPYYIEEKVSEKIE